MSGPTSIAIGENIGGMDLVALAERCLKIRVCEESPDLPGWVAPLGWLPAISVGRLGSTIDAVSVQRCSLLISIASLERHVGKLIRQPSSSWYFESDAQVHVSLTGFNEASWMNATLSAGDATQYNGTEERRVLIPKTRFGGLKPSLIKQSRPRRPADMWQNIRSLRNLIDSLVRAHPIVLSSGSENTLGDQESLGAIMNGLHIDGTCVGLLIECI